LNGINSIRLDVNNARYDSVAARKRVVPIAEVESSTEANKKKQFKSEFSNNTKQNQSNAYSEILLPDRELYRSDLLGEIYSKMSGAEPRSYPGQFVEYYA
jgi:hypothetical protein